MSRVRTLGEFDKLNRFLTLNGEAHGHATGSFSVWTYLVCYLMTGKLLARLVDPENRFAFDPDAREWIDAAEKGKLTPLPELRYSGAQERHVLSRMFGRFYEVHRGAVRKHARVALDEQAPSNRVVTNQESMNEPIEELRRLRGVPELRHE